MQAQPQIAQGHTPSGLFTAPATYQTLALPSLQRSSCFANLSDCAEGLAGLMAESSLPAPYVSTTFEHAAASPSALLLLASLCRRRRLGRSSRCVKIGAGLAPVQGLVHFASPLATFHRVLRTSWAAWCTACLHLELGREWLVGQEVRGPVLQGSSRTTWQQLAACLSWSLVLLHTLAQMQRGLCAGLTAQGPTRQACKRHGQPQPMLVGGHRQSHQRLILYRDVSRGMLFTGSANMQKS